MGFGEPRWYREKPRPCQSDYYLADWGEVFCMKFSKQDHQTWSTLFARQHQNVEKFACQEFKDGFTKLNLTADKIPSLLELNCKITPRTGWKVTRTTSRYMTRKEWFTALTRKQFPITGYIRSQAELDFTPEPDIFHDVFGHQPFMTLPQYVEIFDMFATAWPKAKTDEQKRDIGRLAWFGYEFGVIKEKGKPKAFGAGFLSSFSEIQNITNKQIPKKEFTVENVIAGHKPDGTRVGDRVYGVTKNSELFVFDSLDHLKSELRRFFNTL